MDPALTLPENKFQPDDEQLFLKLFKSSDLSQQEYINLLKCDKEAIYRTLLGRSNVSEYRNRFKPPGEIYLTLEYTPDYVVKYINKPGWGGHLITITTWELLIIDIDLGVLLDDVVELATYYYPKDLFYVHETNKGFHLYLMNRKVPHYCKEAIKMRETLVCDPAHGTNGLYTGNSVRLCLKNDDRLNIASRFVCKVGEGVANTQLQSVYDRIVELSHIFCKYRVNDLHSSIEISQMYNKMLTDHRDDFGLVQVLASTPASSPAMELTYVNDIYSDFVWDGFLKSKVIHYHHWPLLLNKLKKVMGFNNLYRILESTPEYAIGIHVQESLKFIVYRDLLVVDHDVKNRLHIVNHFCRYHREFVFRVVQTPKGYHIFLTSHRMPYNDRKSSGMLERLRSDPCHLISVPYRGYSIRINQKHRRELPYKEIKKIGYGQENQHLVELYQKHLQLYKQCCESNDLLFKIQNTVANDQVR